MAGFLKKWWKEEKAVAAIEAAMLFPVMVSILIGVVDMGSALNLNQKIVNATAMMADLLSREEDVSDSELNEAVIAGQLAFEPYDTASMGYDVAGVQFITAAKTPTVQWRDTFNMDPNGDVTTDSAGLGDEDEGVIAVTIRYTYEPFFTHFVIGAIPMQEVFYTRGRKSVFVTRS